MVDEIKRPTWLYLLNRECCCWFFRGFQFVEISTTYEKNLLTDNRHFEELFLSLAQGQFYNLLIRIYAIIPRQDTNT